MLDALGEGPAAQVAGAGSPAARRLLAEARYYREYVLPWLHRRLRGRGVLSQINVETVRAQVTGIFPG